MGDCGVRIYCTFSEGKKWAMTQGEPMKVKRPPSQHVGITVDIPTKEGKRLNNHAVNATIKTLNLQIAELWEDCWQDDDSPQYELSFGVCKMAA